MKKQHFRNRAELTTALASGRYRGKVLNVTILHDDACTPSICVCEPEFIVEDLTVDTYKAGRRAETAWRRSTTS